MSSHPPLQFTYSRRPKPTIHVVYPKPPQQLTAPTCTIQTRSMSKQQQHKNIFVSTSISPIPRTPTDALNNLDWKSAMLDEFFALMDNKTWELVPRHPHMNIVWIMWIFRYKTKSDGTLERYKARLVCDGQPQ